MQPTQNAKTVFATDLGNWAFALTSLILASLACNILALIYPFLEFSAAFQGRQFYSIPLTITLMWNFGLYAAAILIVAFSLVFPFVKLAILLITLWTPMAQMRRAQILGLLRHLGRWSLLDVYIVLTILVLADDQLFIGAVPRVGVTLFLVAICTSMATSELLHQLNGDVPSTREDLRTPRKSVLYWRSRTVFWPMVVLLPLAIISFFAALGQPFFGITQFLLKHKAYSVINSVTALYNSGFFAFAIPMMAFLVVFPAARLISMAIFGFVPMTQTTRRRLRTASSILGAWSMLDVFALSLLLFLAEGSRLVQFDVRSGLYVILISVCIYYLTLLVNGQAPRDDIKSGAS